MTDDLVERLRGMAAIDGCQASKEAADGAYGDALAAQTKEPTDD